MICTRSQHRLNFRLRYLAVACPDCGAAVGDACDVERMGEWAGFDDEAACHLARALRGGAVEEAKEC